MLYLRDLLQRLVRAILPNSVQDDRAAGGAAVDEADNLVRDTLRVLQERKRVYLYRATAREGGSGGHNRHNQRR
jgi:hypothetical protein